MKPDIQLDGHTIHECIDTGNGVRFEPPMPMDLGGIKVRNGDQWVEPDPLSTCDQVFCPGAIIAIPKRNH